jgi:hypothetical protein
MESEDFVSSGLRFTNGAVCSLVASMASFPGRPETISLYFEKASLNLASGILTVNWRDGRSETFDEAQFSIGESSPPFPKHMWHQRIIENFVDALNCCG